MRFFNKTVMKGALLLLAFITVAEVSTAQTIVPRSGSTIDGISEITITFSSTVVLENMDGISIGLGNTYLPPWDKPGEYGFTVSTEGNVATIKLDRPFTNLYTFEQWGTFFCEAGTFMVGGSPSNELSADWTFSPTKATVPDEPSVTPDRGSTNLSISEISLEWPGCGVEIVGNEYDLEEVKFGIQGSNYSNANIASIEAVGDAGALGYSKVVIKVQNSRDNNQPFNDPGTYSLNVESGIIKINASDGSAMYPGDGFTFYISDYEISPKNMAKLLTFTDLQISGNNLEIKDPSLISLYLGYFDGTDGNVPEESNLVAKGKNVSYVENSEITTAIIEFDLAEPLFNGAYSIFIPANSVTVNGAGINDNNSLYVTFTVEGNMKGLPEWTADPNPGKVTSLSTISVAWGKKEPASNALESFYGDFLTIADGLGYVPVTLELPDGTKEELMGLPRIVTDNNGDVDQAERLGAYLYIMTGGYYTADGNYTLTIPAGTFTVDVDNHNNVPVEETVIKYTIGETTTVILPDPEIRALPSESGWFDAFNVVWWQRTNVPYTLELVKPEQITVTENYVEDVEILSIKLNEFQEDENTPNYDNSQLTVTLADLQFNTGSYYTLYIPAGSVNVIVNGVRIPNQPISYSFQLQNGVKTEVPQPTISPAEGEVENLETVMLSWKGFDVMRTFNELGGFNQPITMSINGGEPQEVSTTYAGEESDAFWNHYPGINLNIAASVNGEYVITIPGNCLQLANEDSGTVYITDPIILTYNVTGLGSESPEIISVNPIVNPSNNYVGGPIGVISVTWPDVRLQMNSQDKDIKTPVDPSFVTITINGNVVPIDPNVTGGGRIWVKAQYETDDVTEWRVDDQFLIELPDIFFFWVGDVKVDIKEGAVRSVSGAVNAPFNLNYTFLGLDYDAIWEPERSTDGEDIFFPEGDCIIFVYWEGYDKPQINANASQKPFYQKINENDNGYQTPASQYMSIEDGKVKFDFSTFDLGSYILDVPDNAIILSEGVNNGETIYNFSIVDRETLSVAGIFGRDSVFSIYSLQGVKLMETTVKEDLKRLTKGIYIINGKKVIIR